MGRGSRNIAIRARSLRAYFWRGCGDVSIFGVLAKHSNFVARNSKKLVVAPYGVSENVTQRRGSRNLAICARSLHAYFWRCGDVSNFVAKTCLAVTKREAQTQRKSVLHVGLCVVFIISPRTTFVSRVSTFCVLCWLWCFKILYFVLVVVVLCLLCLLWLLW